MKSFYAFCALFLSASAFADSYVVGTTLNAYRGIHSGAPEDLWTKDSAPFELVAGAPAREIKLDADAVATVSQDKGTGKIAFEVSFRGTPAKSASETRRFLQLNEQGNPNSGDDFVLSTYFYDLKAAK